MPKRIYLSFTISRKNNGEINVEATHGDYRYRVLKDKTGCVYGILPIDPAAEVEDDWTEIGSVELGMLACQKHARGE